MYYNKVLRKIVDKYKNLSNDKTKGVNILEAQVLESVMRKPYVSPKSHADFLKIDYVKVVQIMRYFALNSRVRRASVFKEVDTYLNLIVMQLNHERASTINQEIRTFAQNLPEKLRAKCGTAQLMRGFYLLALLKFCSDHKYHDIFPQRQLWVKNLSAIEARNFFRDISYEIYKQEKGFNVNSLTDLIKESVQENTVDSEEETPEDKIQALEFKLQTTQATLNFIQRSLNDMVINIEQKTKDAEADAVNNFFAQLNSERYGRLLDNTVLIDQKISNLRKQHYKFPLEIMAMPMIIKNFMAFVKGIGFEPMRTLGEKFEATAEDLIYDVYEGTPFMQNEQKLVQVVCPGWKREGVILSKPIVKEVAVEEI